MPDNQTLLAFLFAALVFAYVPGPSLIYAAAQTLAKGRRAGWLAALGLHLGCYVHIIATAAGLAYLLKAVPVGYLILKTLGALYLIWLGFNMIRGAASTSSPLNSEAIAKKTTASDETLWQSALVEVFNPKTALFFVAFLPQFVDPAAAWPVWVQLLAYGTVVNLLFSSADVACVILSSWVLTTLRTEQGAAAWMQRIGGGGLVALGAHLALSNN